MFVIICLNKIESTKRIFYITRKNISELILYCFISLIHIVHCDHYFQQSTWNTGTRTKGSWYSRIKLFFKCFDEIEICNSSHIDIQKINQLLLIQRKNVFKFLKSLSKILSTNYFIITITYSTILSS